MPLSYWKRVMTGGLLVPSDRSLEDLTTELTTMLGERDPAVRDGVAYPILATWIERGVYDDLLAGLGDGLVTGLSSSQGPDPAIRRSYTARTLAACLERDAATRRLAQGTVLNWGDALAGWFLAETDLRSYEPGIGWIYAVGHGADAIAALGESPHLGAGELPVLLEVCADRMIRTTDHGFRSGEPDRVAAAVLRILRRDLLTMDHLEDWVRRLAGAASASPRIDRDPYASTHNPEALLRSLYLQLTLAPQPPQVRSDLLISLAEALQHTNRLLLTPR